MKTIRGVMATDSDKELCMYQAKEAARKAVEFLEMRATGAARAALLEAVAAIEKLHMWAA